MKLKALASLCNEAKTVQLFNAADGTQWAGTGYAVYRLPENLGQLTEDALCAIFDIPPGKRGKMQIKTKELPDAYDTDDTCTGERELMYWLDRRLILSGRDMLPCKVPGGEVICIQTKTLKPGSDAEQPGLCIRKTETGAPYIVFKDGLFVQAIIMPCRVEPEELSWLGDVVGGITVEDNETV